MEEISTKFQSELESLAHSIVGEIERVNTIKKMDGRRVEVGISDDAKYPNGTPVYKVAGFVEYGTSKMAPRSFLRSTEDENGKMWVNEISAEVEKMVEKNEDDMDSALKEVGEKVKENIQNKITQIGAVRTGKLRDSVEVNIV